MVAEADGDAYAVFAGIWNRAVAMLGTTGIGFGSLCRWRDSLVHRLREAERAAGAARQRLAEWEASRGELARIAGVLGEEAVIRDTVEGLAPTDPGADSWDSAPSERNRSWDWLHEGEPPRLYLRVIGEPLTAWVTEGVAVPVDGVGPLDPAWTWVEAAETFAVRCAELERALWVAHRSVKEEAYRLSVVSSVVAEYEDGRGSVSAAPSNPLNQKEREFVRAACRIMDAHRSLISRTAVLTTVDQELKRRASKEWEDGKKWKEGKAKRVAVKLDVYRTTSKGVQGRLPAEEEAEELLHFKRALLALRQRLVIEKTE